MSDYPVNLKHIYFTRSIVISNPNHTPTGVTVTSIKPINHINVEKHPEIHSDYIVTMKMIFNQDNDPISGYSIDMECVALFSVENLNDTEALKAVTVIGHSVTYGAIREAVLWITARHPFGPLSLGLSILGAQKEQKPDEK
jgi:preprotein translocase subunit SecB